MSEAPSKKWTPGAADEAWKVLVCARAAVHADDLISGLIYIVTDAGADTERGIVALRSMSGEAIMDALVNYQRAAHQSVASALPLPVPTDEPV